MGRETHILALDQGTSSSRAILFDRAGRIVAVAQEAFRQIYPRPGWVEHDPLAIWTSQSSTVDEVLARAGVASGAIVAVGLTNQRETTLLWDRGTGEPVYNAIVWQDRRTADFCGELKRRGVEPSVAAKTGLRLDPYFSATKIRWILDNVDGARRRAENGKLCFGTVDTWLLWQLTGGTVHLTDATNASRTLLLNLRTGDWDDEMLELFGVPRSILPGVRSSSEVYGRVGPERHPAGVPVAGMAGDQQAALFGQACFHPGMAKNTYGTGCFLLMNTGSEPIPSENNLLTTIAWQVKGKTEYALEGSVFIGGAAVQWLRDELKMVATAAELDELAGSVPDAGGLFIVPAFSGLGAPHWDPYARGVAVGITRGTNRAHFCRAVLEGIAFQIADLIACMERDSGLDLKELRVDGGASRSEPLLRFQADLLGRPVVRPENIETTALGAACLAGLAVGFWETREAIARDRAAGARFERQKDAAAMQRLRENWNRAVERAKNWETDLSAGGG